MGYARWTEEEIEYLVNNYEEKNIYDISKTLNRSKDSVHKKAKRLKLTKSVKRWSENEITFLAENWGTYTKKEIAKALKRSDISIKKKAFELKLGPERIGNGQFLTNGDIGYLLNKDPNLIYRWTKEGYIRGTRFGDKGIFQIKPKDFLEFLKDYQDKWDASSARTDFVKLYFYTAHKFELPSWFIEKMHLDKKNAIR